MADNEIVYEVKANTKPVEDSLKKVDASAKEVAGDDGGFGKLNLSIQGLATAAIAAGAAIATYLVGQGLRAGISAAIEQEDALNRMNQALNNAGRLSVDSSADFVKFASEIQNTTKVADDAAMSFLALATAFTKNNEQTKQVTQAAIDMSAALGVSVDTAIRQLGGSLNGVAGRLGVLVPEIRGLTEEQLKAGRALEIISQKFGGSAAAAANTFSGRLTQMKNAFGDVLEEIGMFFTKSDSLRKAFGFIADGIRQLVTRLGILRESSGDVFKPLLIAIGYVAKAIVFTLGPVLEAAYNFIQVTARGIAQLAAIMTEAFTGNFAGAAHLAKEAFNEGFNMEMLLDSKGTESAMAYVNSFIETIRNSEGIIQENLPESMQGGPIIEAPKAEETVAQLDIMGAAYEGMFNRVKITADNMKKLYGDMRKQLFTTMVNGVQSAMNAVGQALVNGGNAFEAFGKAMLGMFGQLATQLGMFYFLLGLATVYNDPARGAAMIAGGLALMVFGGVLQALAGGGGAATGGGGAATAGGGAGTAGTIGDTTVAQNETEQRERQTNVEVVVQGNVIGDKREFGIQIADAINEAFGNDGIILARGAIS